MKKLTDYIADTLVNAGHDHVFILTGGGAMHLNDSLGNHPKFKKIYLHHEQALAMAAESYARLSGKIPIVNVTTGPGGINAINGVFGAWVDSLPMLVLSGQVRFETTTYSTDLNLRQLGDQECRIVEMVKGITKYAQLVTDANSIQYHLEKALFLAGSGRKGPVWLDIPMNIQGAYVEADQLVKFHPSFEKLDQPIPKISSASLENIATLLMNAKRPLILCGSGIRLANMHAPFMELIDALQIPVVTAWNAHDVLPDTHALNVGKPGTIGDRSGNFAVQNADCILILGSRLNIRQISYNWESFAKNAYKIMVDIDVNELQKHTLKIDLPIHANLNEFIPQFLEFTKQQSFKIKQDWLSWCQIRKAKYPVCKSEYWNILDKVNPYCFMDRLGELLPLHQIIVTGDGTACVAAFQAIKIKTGQRLYTNSGCASMGYDLPAAIGAYIGSGKKDIVCLAGDGSIMQNIQELASIAYNNYAIKIFILNNNGYHSIRQTQQNFFATNLVGVGPDSGLGFPSFEKIAAGFEIPYLQCTNHAMLTEKIEATLAHKGPIICEVMLDLKQVFAPKLASRKLEDGRLVTSPLEDMAPFLSREELAENMILDCS